MKLAKLFILTTAASACAVSVYATPGIPELVITQTSDTSMTATYNGSPLTVDEFSTDKWFISGFSLLGLNGAAQWSDPDDAGQFNFVTGETDTTFGLGFLVHTDDASQSVPTFANDTKDSTPDFGYLADFIGNTYFPVNVTFNDEVGSTGTVPDASTTMPLLGLAVGGLFGLARRMRK